MEDLCICKICKKVFTDKHGLREHQMTTHPVQHQQLNNNEPIIPQQFRNHSNISITRIPGGGGGGGIGKEFKSNSQVVVIQSGTMNQNQNMYGRKTAGPPSSMKMKQGEGARVKPPQRSPDHRLKQAPASGGNSVRQLVSKSMGLDDATTDWRKWTPPQPARGGADPNRPDVISPNRPRTTDGQIITQSAAERAMLAIPQSSAAAANARKNVPKLLPMVPQGNKRGGAGAQRVALASPGTSGTGVANIMKNLGKMKDLSQPSRSPINPKLISLSQVNKKAIPPPPIPVVNKPPAPRKQKIVPRNSFNNAMPVAPPPVASSKPKANTQPKQQAAAGKRIPPVHPPPSALELDEEEDDDDMVIDDQQPEEAEEEEEFDEEPEPLIQPAKKSVPAATVAPSKAAGAGGKAPPQKKNMNNRFNPIQTSPKKGKGAQAGSPNGKSAKVAPGGGGGVVPSTSASAANGTNKKSAAGVASAAGGGGGAVVAKKSNAAAAKPTPPPKVKGKKKGKEDTLTRLKNYVPTMPGTDYEMPKLSAIGSYTNRQGQQVWVCLVCNEKESEDSSKDMICCEMCEDWYHWECVGIRESMAEDDPWYCKRCIYQACPPNKAKKDFPRIFKNDVFD